MCKGIAAILFLFFSMVFYDTLSSDAIIIIRLLSIALFCAFLDDMHREKQKKNDDKVREDSKQEK